ncbi:MAG TPA: hypothetical protein VKU37_09355 [Verrucomicrobiae bacterium]|nr:hypothetical protein [Verrucomicrobiae bacterium]
MNVAVMDNQYPNPVPPPAKSKHAGIQQRHQAAALQRLAFDGAMSLKAACTDKESGRVTMDVKTAVAVHKLIGAWDTAADRLRVLRGRGLPASERRKPKREVPIEPLDPA